MTTKQQPDWTLIERAILIELQRQGFEFAEVKHDEHYPDNPVFVNVRTETEIQPKYLELVRISNKLAKQPPTPAPSDAPFGVGDRVLSGDSLETITKVSIWDDGTSTLDTVDDNGKTAKRYGDGPKAPKLVNRPDQPQPAPAAPSVRVKLPSRGSHEFRLLKKVIEYEANHIPGWKLTGPSANYERQVAKRLEKKGLIYITTGDDLAPGQWISLTNAMKVALGGD